MQQSVGNMCAKFKVDPLSRFRTGSRQVFTTQKHFPSGIPLTMKMQHQILFKHIFRSNSLRSNFFWNLWRQTNRYSSKKVNIWTPSWYFPFFISFFCWNGINKKSSRKGNEKDWKQSPQPVTATLLKKRPCHRCFLVSFAKFLRTPFLTEHLQSLLLKDRKLWSR